MRIAVSLRSVGLEVSDVVWQTLIQVVGYVILTIVLAKINARAKEAASQAEQVRTTLLHTTTEAEMQRVALANKMDHVAVKVDEVHKATNGLVAKAEEAAHARGVKDEHDRPK